MKTAGNTVTKIDPLSTSPPSSSEIAGDQSHKAAELSVLVGDHDLFKALAKVLDHHGVKAGAESMWTAFMTGLSCAHLPATDWYQELAAWGTANMRETFVCPCAI